MTHTSLPGAHDLSPRPLRARLHVRRIGLRTGRPALPRRPAGGGPVREAPPGGLHPSEPSYATAPGGAISRADDLATWIRALVTGKVLGPAYQRLWLRGPRAEDPAAPGGSQYGYGIARQRFGPHASMYYHGGELPGFNSFIGYAPDNDVTLVIWTNLTLSPEGRTTAQALLPTVLDQIYTGLSLPTGD
ncbi:serine hydrolase domain-containing protein [Streptomyces sp. NPDC051133]|uniref:serine hydrolase domain-containing protein n=1 Tax=Streptomyces sp. NPDC051133 TaxID=3155521 RepID=UPI003437E7F7